MILDCRVSGTNSATTKYERIVLPLVWDVVRNALGLMAGKVDGSEVSWLVCDFQDAFYKLPLNWAEQGYYAVVFQGRVYIWLRVGQ